jgi:hypothetical protein
MKSSFFAFDHVHLLGQSATHPMALRLPRHTALLRLAGSSPLRCRALSGSPITAPSGAPNCRFQVKPTARHLPIQRVPKTCRALQQCSASNNRAKSRPARTQSRNCGNSRMASALEGEKQRSAAARCGNHCQAVCSRGLRVTSQTAGRHRPNTCSVL